MHSPSPPTGPSPASNPEAAWPAAAPPPRHAATSQFIEARGLRHHVLRWHQAAGPVRRVLLHGYMDCAASWQFVVDACHQAVPTAAPDWRGFGRSEVPEATDAFWFADYLGDLDALLRAFSPSAPVDLIGHSMGGHVVMAYAAARPERVRRVVNLEGFGLPDARPAEAVARSARWLDQLAAPMAHRRYASLDEVAERLRAQNPRLSAARARWLAPHWAKTVPTGDGGGFTWRAHPAHKRVNPVLHRAAESEALWQAIRAPVLWLQAQGSHPEQFWGARHTQADFERRLAQVPDHRSVVVAEAGHMLHHDQPEAVAAAIEDFLEG